MTEITTDIAPPPGIGTPPDPSGLLANLVVALLAPMFLGVTAGDIGLARLAAIETLDAYRADNHAGLLAVGQIVAFGLAALGSLSLSVADDISLSMALRLRSNANALNRSAEQNRRALIRRTNDLPAAVGIASGDSRALVREGLPEAFVNRPDLAALPGCGAVSSPDAGTIPGAPADLDAVSTHAATANRGARPNRGVRPNRGTRPASDAGPVRGALPAVDTVSKRKAAPDLDVKSDRRTRPTPDGGTTRLTMPELDAVSARHATTAGDILLSVAAAQELAVDAQARLQPAEPSLHQPPAPAANRSTVPDKRHRAMWAIAMVKEAQEISAGLQNLPSAERGTASLRAATLSSTANHLLYGLPAVSPKPAAQV